MNQLIADYGLSDQIKCDSAGTSGAHDGEPADQRMRDAGKKRGYTLSSISRKLTHFDLEEFDLIIAMDQNNFCNIKDLAYEETQVKKIKSMCSFCQTLTACDVPDPYMGGGKGFEIVLDILEDACRGLLRFVIEKYRLEPNKG